MADLTELRERYEKLPRGVDAHLAGRLAALRRFNSFWVHKVWPHPWVSLGVGALFSVAGVALLGKPIGWKVLAGGIAALGWGLGTFLLLQREFQQLVREGVFVLAMPVKANEALHRPGSKPAPGAAVFTLDPKLRLDPAFLGELASRLAGLGESDEPPGDGTDEAWSFLRNDLARDCIELPAELAGAKRCYLSGMVFDPSTLPGRQLGDGPIPALARVGPRWAVAATLLQL